MYLLSVHKYVSGRRDNNRVHHQKASKSISTHFENVYGRMYKCILHGRIYAVDEKNKVIHRIRKDWNLYPHHLTRSHCQKSVDD
jgi:hypothetical protein